MPQYALSPPAVLLANAVLLLLAFGLAVVVSDASFRYRRHIGDVPRQTRYKYVVMYGVLLLLALALAAAALNLIFS